MAKILVVAAHPDDEVLGCGGTIVRHVAMGDRVDILFMADGEGARGGGAKAKRARMEAAFKSAKALGAKRPECLGFPDNRMDSVPILDVVQALEQAAAKLRPEIVYTHHHGDLNVDHRITHQAVMTAFRPVSGSFVRSIFGFEIPSSTEWASPHFADTFLPTMFVDITPYAESKRRALAAYAAEMRPAPHPRSAKSLEALARWRGACGGMTMAEAFTVLRMLTI